MNPSEIRRKNGDAYAAFGGSGPCECRPVIAWIASRLVGLNPSDSRLPGEGKSIAKIFPGP